MSDPEILGYTEGQGEPDRLHTSEGSFAVQNMTGQEAGTCADENCKRPAHEPVHYFIMSYVPVELHDHPDCRKDFEPLEHEVDCWCQEN